MRRILMSVMGAGLFLAATTATAFAESRPLEQLPSDAARLSTEWVAVPAQIAETHRYYGPLAAATWGPVKGAAVMARATTADLWQAFRPDRKPGHSRPGASTRGALFRYEF